MDLSQISATMDVVAAKKQLKEDTMPELKKSPSLSGLNILDQEGDKRLSTPGAQGNPDTLPLSPSLLLLDTSALRDTRRPQSPLGELGELEELEELEEPSENSKPEEYSVLQRIAEEKKYKYYKPWGNRFEKKVPLSLELTRILRKGLPRLEPIKEEDKTGLELELAPDSQEKTTPTETLDMPSPSAGAPISSGNMPKGHAKNILAEREEEPTSLMYLVSQKVFFY